MAYKFQRGVSILSGSIRLDDNLSVSGSIALADGSVDILDLDIDGATDIGAALVNADLFVVDDGAGGTNRKSAMSRIPTFLVDHTSLTSLTSLAGVGTLTAGQIGTDGSPLTAYINAGEVDGVTIGGETAAAATFTTCDATTNFTIDGLVITADTITNDAVLEVVSTGLTLNASLDIALSADGGNVTMDDGTTTIFDFNVDDTTLTIHDDQDTGDKVVMTMAQHGAFTIETTDDDAAAANILITADGTFEAVGTTITLDSGGAINLEPAAGSNVLIDGNIAIDGSVVTGASSITSTAFVGGISGGTLAGTSLVLASGATVTGIEDSDTLSSNSATLLATQQSIKAYVDATAANAATVTVADTTDTTCFVGLWESATGDIAARTDAGLTYNAGTGMLTATGLTGPVDGVLGGNTPAAATVTTLSATGDVDLGDATGDTITATGRFDSDLVPSTDSARDLGTSTLQWAEAHINAGYIDAITVTGTSTLTTVDINGGAIDGAIIGANSAQAGTFAALVGTSLSVGDGNITNVGDINCDSISVDGAAAGLDIDGSGADTGTFKLSMKDNVASGLDINQGGTSYLKFITTNDSEQLTAGKYIEVSNKGIGVASDLHASLGKGSRRFDGVYSLTSSANMLTGSGFGPLVYATTLYLGDRTEVTATAAELNYNDLTTLGTAQASKAMTWAANSSWTAAGGTCADLGIVTTVDVNGGTVDGATIGAASHTTGKFTTVDATTDFTIDGLVLTADTITNDAALTIVSTGLTFNASLDIALSADGDNITMDDGTTTMVDFDLSSNAPTLKLMDGAQVANYFSIGVAANGATTLTTVDTDAAAANLIVTADGTVDIDSAGLMTLDSGAGIALEPAAGSAVLIDGAASFDGDQLTGLASITSTAFVGTLSTAAQANVTSLGTLTTLTVSGDATLTGNSANAVWDSSEDALEFADNASAEFGTGLDMKLYHDGTNSYITNAVGALKIADQTSGIAVSIGHSTSEVTVNDNLTVTGDLTVNGATTTVDVTNLTIEDPLIKLGKGDTGTSNDKGIIFSRGNGSLADKANKGLIWDESADVFAFIECDEEAGTTSGNVTVGGYAHLKVGLFTATGPATVDALNCSGLATVNGLKVTSQTRTEAAPTLDLANGSCVFVNRAAGSTITLPNTSGVGAGEQIQFKDIAGLTIGSSIVLEGNGAQTVDGELNIALESPYAGVTLICDGSNWWVL